LSRDSGLGVTRKSPQQTHDLLILFPAMPADPYAAVEADRFARFLRKRNAIVEAVSYLGEVLAFEFALIAATLHGHAYDIE
jgi:hypothetical protein